MFKDKYNYYLQLVEKQINSLPVDHNTLIGESMMYSLVGGGKRIRPVLSLVCSETVGGNPQEIVEAAVGLELIHTYSLIHDDLPCMDNDDYRRGKLANHKKYGEALALLAGDALLTLGFELMAGVLAAGAEKQLRVIRETAFLVGWQGMVGGQVLDTMEQQENLLMEDIEQIHLLKTGALLKASARLGAILGGGTEKEIELLSQYAAFLGLAFQIKDDILDIEGDSKILGKPVGSDERQNKTTYPSLLGNGSAKRHLEDMIAKAKDTVSVFGEQGEFLRQLADYVGSRAK